MRRALLLLVLLAPAAFAQRQPEQSLVLTASRALMLLEPRTAVSQNALNLSVSPSGRYLVAVQEVPSERPLELGKPAPGPKVKRIVIWDSTTGATREIPLPMDVIAGQVFLRWIAGTEKLLVSTPMDVIEVSAPGAAQGHPPMLQRLTEWQILDAQSGLMKKVFSDDGRSNKVIQIAVSPVSPIAVKVETLFGRSGPQTDSTVSLQTMRIDGSWGNTVKLPRVIVNSGAIGWSPDGRTFQLEVQTLPDGGDAPTPRVLKFDPATGSYEDVLGPVPSYDKKEPERDVKVTYDVTPLENFPAKRTLATWWLTSTTETEHGKAVIAEHAMGAFLAQGDKFVAYIVNGTVFTRQIVELTLAQYEQMRDGAARAETLSKAKQVALGLMMLAADNDDTISADFKLSDLAPYLRNNSILEGFVMVFTGGSLRDVKDPANTVLGYTEGPGGRAVAYMDGHVKWEKTGG